MSGINNVVLAGRLTRDVEVQKTGSGVSYARFTVACDRRYSGGQNQQNPQQPTADFIQCVAWRQSADFLGTYAKKGMMVGVLGSIQTGNYTDRDGRKVYTTDVLADRVSLLERAQGQGQPQQNAGGYNQPQQGGYPQPQQNAGGYNQPQQGGGSYQNRIQNNYGNGGQQGGYNAPAPANDNVDFGGGAPFDIATDDLPF